MYPFLQTQIEGLTGTVQFDEMGKRTQFILDLVELDKTEMGLEQVSNHTVIYIVSVHAWKGLFPFFKV